MIQTTPGATARAELNSGAGLALSGRITDNGVPVQTIPASAVTFDESYEMVFTAPATLGRMSVEWRLAGATIATEVLWVQAVVTPVQRIAGQAGTIELENLPAGYTLTARLQDNGVTVLTIPTGSISFDEAYIGTLVWPEPAGRLTVQWLEAGVVIASEVVATTAFEPGYTTVDDLRLALAPGGDTGPGSAAHMPDEELADAIFEAAQEVDARLSDRYAVPFDPVPGLVAQITRDIAAFKATLVDRKGNPLDARDPIWLRYMAAVGTKSDPGLLRQIATGEVDLIGAAGEDIQSGGGNATVINQFEGDLFPMCDLGLVQTYGPYRGPVIWP
jgi:phage gp36-like protein